MYDKFVKTSTVSINIMKVDNKKLTKSLIDQFDNVSPFDNMYNCTTDKIFGYVKLPRPKNGGMYLCIIHEKNGKLCKYSASTLQELAGKSLQTKVNNINISNNIRSILNKDFEKYFQSHLHSEKYFFWNDENDQKLIDVLSDEGKEVVIELLANADTFYTELLNHQILY